MDETPTPKPVRRASAQSPGAGMDATAETKVVGAIPPARHSATAAKRHSASPAPNMRTSAGMGDLLGENRRVVSAIDSVINSDILSDTSDRNALLRSYPGKTTEGKYVAHSGEGAQRHVDARRAQASSSFTSAMSQFGMSPDFDNYDTLDILAQQLIQLLQGTVYNFANLTKYERNILFRYFHKYNPVIARIVDLHTDLPLSKARLQAPQGVPEIVRDYIQQFYEHLFKKLDLNRIMREMVFSYYVYGEAYIQVDDSFGIEADRVLQDISLLDEKVYKHSPEDLKFLQETERAYSKTPTSISLHQRTEYIKKKFNNFFDDDYKGPTKLAVLEFYNILEYLENKDIDFEAIRYGMSESLRRLKELGLDNDGLCELGYSRGFLDLLDLDGDPDSYTIDNNTLSGLPFMFTFRRPDAQSLITRVLNEAVEWDAAKRAIKAKIDNLGKMGRIITAEGTSEQQIEQLRVEVTMMLEDPNHAVVANYPIEWNEVNSFIKEELNELVARLADLKVDIAMGAGIPDSLLSGESAYSGDNVKLELLNTYYLAFNQRLQTVIEEKLMKPIAMRKGFVAVDEWGNPMLIYPKMTFTRMGIRDSGTMDTLFNLYQKGSMPISVILDVLNLDPDTIRRGVESDQFSVNDPNWNGLIAELFSQAAGDIYQTSTLKQKLQENLNLPERYGDETTTTPAMQDAETGGGGSGAAPGGDASGDDSKPGDSPAHPKYTAPDQLPTKPADTPMVTPPQL